MCLAVPGRVIAIFEHHGLRMADADFGGTVRKICLDQLPEAEAGDFVLVHIGLAVSRIDSEDAERRYRALDGMRALSGLDEEEATHE